MIIKILFKNNDFVVVDKPHGLSVHNNEDPDNLLKVLETQLKVAKLYPIHRLDKETSGVQVLALNESSAKVLSEQFQNRSVLKEYVAILRGVLKMDHGVWSRPLTDRAEGRKNPAGLSNARVKCETQFTVLRRSKYFTYCKFNLITGRQHQIRKHAAIERHELIGDRRYGDSKYIKKISSIYKAKRMYLHCSKIEILGEVISSECPTCFEELMTN